MGAATGRLQLAAAPAMVLACLALAGGVMAADVQDSADRGASISLRAGEVSLRDRGLSKASLLQAPRGRRGVMVFDGLLTESRRAALGAAGVSIVQYAGGSAYIVRTDGADAGALAALGFVRGSAEFDSSWKASASFTTHQFSSHARRTQLQGGQARVRVHLFADATAGEVAGILDYIGELRDAQAFRTTLVGGNTVFSAEIRMADVSRLTRLEAVQFVEHAPEITDRNSTVQWVVQSNVIGSTPLHANGLTGLGEVVGICDSGLDDDHCAFTNPPGKLLAFNGAANITNHGTHTSATAIGNDAGDLQGHAYDASFVFSRQPAFTFSDLYSILDTQASQTATVHTNSWGDDTTNEYTGMTRSIDAFMHDDEDQLVIFATTNGATLKSPENAKNCVSVVASDDTPTQDDFCRGGFGLTTDLRLKPDVYAPGCNITSAQGFSACGTITFTGTSMAAPAVAGTAALMRQYFNEGFYPSGVASPSDAFTPSGALLKGCLINCATGIGGFPDLPAQQLNFQGWGRILADDALFFAGDARALVVMDVRNTDGLVTGSVSEHEIDVLSNTQSLRVTLVWTDAPPAPGAAAVAVNNLNLEVIDPGFLTYRGNNFTAGESFSGGTFDQVNNVEQVHISAPAAGPWTIRITGASVPDGPQGYALVVTGDVAVPPAPLTISAVDPPTLIAPNDPSAVFNVEIDEGDDTLVGGSPMLHYRYSGAVFSAIPLLPIGGSIYQAKLPLASCGHTPEFYVSAAGVLTGTQTAPPGGPLGSYSAALGTETQSTLLSEDFAGGLPAGWTANDLWHVTSACERLPLCNGSAAPWAYFGSDALCSYNTGATQIGALSTPVIALPALAPGERLTLTYCSNMDNENLGIFDRGFVRFATIDLDEAPNTGLQWETRTVDFAAFAGQADAIRFVFNSNDAFANDFGGWQVDNIVLTHTQIACVEPCPGDVNGDLVVNAFDFSDFAPNFGLTVNATRDQGDLDGNGTVDSFDFALFAPWFGDSCP